jgi:hypothetical protein
VACEPDRVSDPSRSSPRERTLLHVKRVLHSGATAGGIAVCSLALHGCDPAPSPAMFVSSWGSVHIPAKVVATEGRFVVEVQLAESVRGTVQVGSVEAVLGGAVAPVIDHAWPPSFAVVPESGVDEVSFFLPLQYVRGDQFHSGLRVVTRRVGTEWRAEITPKR